MKFSVEYCFVVDGAEHIDFFEVEAGSASAAYHAAMSHAQLEGIELTRVERVRYLDIVCLSC